MRARLSGLASSLFLLAGLVMALPGCTAAIMQSDIFQGDSVNLKESSYGAADMLSQPAKQSLKPGEPILVGVLTDLEPQQVQAVPVAPVAPAAGQPVALSPAVPVVPVMAAPSPSPPVPFGRVIAQQIGARFVQLGFNVVGDAAGRRAGRAGEAMITGQYARANGKVLINLKVVETATGRVLSAYDYSMPVNGEIDALLSPGGQSPGLFDFLN